MEFLLYSGHENPCTLFSCQWQTGEGLKDKQPLKGLQDPSAAGTLLKAESSFFQCQNKCCLWARSSKCLVSVKGSKCCARRSGWCTTASSKGEFTLITASGLRRRNLDHPCDIVIGHGNTSSGCLAALPRWTYKPWRVSPLQGEQGFSWSCVPSEPAFHHLKDYTKDLSSVTFSNLLRS